MFLHLFTWQYSGLFYFCVPSGKILTGVPFLCLNRTDASQIYGFCQFLMQPLKLSCLLSVSLVMGKCRRGKIFCALVSSERGFLSRDLFHFCSPVCLECKHSGHCLGKVTLCINYVLFSKWFPISKTLSWSVFHVKASRCHSQENIVSWWCCAEGKYPDVLGKAHDFPINF